MTSILPIGARLALLLIALAAGGAAWWVARRGRPRRAILPLTLTAGLAVLVLLADLLIALTVGEAGAGAEFNEFRWVLLSPWGAPGIILGSAATIAVFALAVLGTRAEPRPLPRAVLVALRGGAALAALVVFLQPALELRHVVREPNHVAILVDDSRSMVLADAPGGPTRAARAAALLAESEGAFAAWRDEHVLDVYSFSSDLASSTLGVASAAGGLPARADATRMREALAELRGRYPEGDLGGVILISDGVDTSVFADGVSSGAARDFLGGLEVPVHTAWAGRPGLRDLAISRVDVDEVAFVRTVVKLSATVRATGLPATDVPVVLREGARVIRQATVRVGGDTPSAQVAFEITPERVGKYVYTFEVPLLDGEAVAGNNSRAFILRVIRDKVRVLLVAGRPSWDERALRGLLKSDPNVDLVSFFILRTPDDVQLVRQEEMSLIPFPTEELFQQQLGSFDAIILQNFEFEKYGIGPYLQNMKDYVEAGGALAMVGGDLAFSSGGYDGTPVGDILPMRLLSSSGGRGERLVSTERFTPRLTAEGQRHPVTRLAYDAADNLKRWASLPPLAGVNLVAGPTSDATVLMTHPALRGSKGPMPVLAVREAKLGRTLALTTDSSWHWGFLAAGTPGDDGRSHQRFWENALRWLLRDPELSYLRVESDQAAYGPGDAPKLTVSLLDHDYLPAAGRKVSLELRRDGDPGPATLREVTTDDAGQAELALEPPVPGAYRVAAKARLAETDVTTDDVFLVDAERAELERPAARDDVLAGIAAATGGRALGAVDELPADLPLLAPRVVRVDRRRDVELWSRPALLVIALGLLCAEWALRRRRGYA